MIRKGLRLDSFIFILPFYSTGFYSFNYLVYESYPFIELFLNYFLRFYPFIELFIILFILRIHPLFYRSIYDFIFSLYFHFFLL